MNKTEKPTSWWTKELIHLQLQDGLILEWKGRTCNKSIVRSWSCMVHPQTLNFLPTKSYYFEKVQKPYIQATAGINGRSIHQISAFVGKTH